MGKTSTAFSEEMDEKLIDLVRLNPLLYDRSDTNSKNIIMKENIWAAIARQLGRTDTDCKARWRSMRDAFKKVKKFSTASKRSKYNSETFAFLDASLRKGPFTVEAQGENGYEKWFSDGSHHSDTNPFDSVEVNYITEDNVETDEEEERTREGKRPCWDEEEGGIIVKTEPLSVCDGDEGPSGMTVRKKRKRCSKYSQEYQIVEEEDAENSTQVNVGCITEVHECNAGRTAEAAGGNPIESFFKCMAQTVMGFAPDLIAETRLQVCEIVTKMEIKNLQRQSAIGSTERGCP